MVIDVASTLFSQRDILHIYIRTTCSQRWERKKKKNPLWGLEKIYCMNLKRNDKAVFISYETNHVLDIDKKFIYDHRDQRRSRCVRGMTFHFSFFFFFLPLLISIVRFIRLILKLQLWALQFYSLNPDITTMPRVPVCASHNERTYCFRVLPEYHEGFYIGAFWSPSDSWIIYYQILIPRSCTVRNIFDSITSLGNHVVNSISYRSRDNIGLRIFILVSPWKIKVAVPFGRYTYEASDKINVFITHRGLFGQW